MTKETVLAYLMKHGTRSNVEGMKRFGIRSPKAFGVSAPVIRALAKRIGTEHALALSLWKTGYLEARILASLIADPEKMTGKSMEAWVRDFDSWAVCDTCCSELFVYTPFAGKKSHEWSRRRNEYVKRAGFVMMAALAVHRKELDDTVFTAFFPDIERASTDPRNFVRKGVNWALRQIGKRNIRLHATALKIAAALSERNDPTARWIGKDAVRDLLGQPVRRRFARMKERSK